MLEYFLKFNQESFYQEKNRNIGEVVQDYARLKAAGAPAPELATARERAESLLAGQMQECGLAGEESTYFSLEKEFFSPEGDLDEKRLGSFRIKMLRHYTAQQLRWSFAGTSSQFTQITEREMAKKNQDYSKQLPLELQRDHRKRDTQRRTTPQPGKYQAFIYQDGTVSPELLESKKRLQFNVLRDNSGFAWERGYSPDNEVVRENWTGHFNSSGEWVKAEFAAEEPFHPSRQRHPVAAFTGHMEAGKLGLLSSQGMIYFFDHESLLQEGEVESAYTLEGELYTRREVDREQSLANLLEVLKEKKITKIDTIVLRSATPEAQAYYRQVLAPYMREDTRFLGRTDENLLEELKQMREQTAGQELSQTLAEGFLSAPGLEGEALYDKLLPASLKPTYAVGLNIFQSSEELQTFLSLPEVADNLEEEGVSLLKAMQVPAEKQTACSNAVQNILHSYRELFAHSALPQTEILQAAYDLHCDDTCRELIRRENISTEQTLYEFIRSALTPGAKTAIPSFRQFEEPARIDFSDPAVRAGWLQTQVATQLPPESAAGLGALLAGDTFAALDPQVLYPAAGRILKEYKAIAGSTGMRPEEILKALATVMQGGSGSKELQRKRVFFEAPLENLLREAALYNPHRVTVYKEEESRGPKPVLTWHPFSQTPNLFDPGDLEAFLTSPLCRESGFSDLQISEIASFLQNVQLPQAKQALFSAGVIKLIRGYKYRLKPAGSGIMAALEGLSVLLGRSKPVQEPRFLKMVAEVAGLPGAAQRILFTTADPARLTEEEFLALPLVAASGIAPEESSALYGYLQNMSAQHAPEASRTPGSLTPSGQAEPGGLSARQKVEDTRLPGQLPFDNLPAPQQPIDNLLAPKQSLDSLPVQKEQAASGADQGLQPDDPVPGDQPAFRSLQSVPNSSSSLAGKASPLLTPEGLAPGDFASGEALSRDDTLSSAAAFITTEEQPLLEDLALVLQRYTAVIRPAGFHPLEVLLALRRRKQELAPPLRRIVEALPPGPAARTAPAPLWQEVSYVGEDSTPVPVTISSADEEAALLAGDLKNFLASPLVTDQLMAADEAKALHKYVQRARFPAEQADLFRKAVIRTIRQLPQDVRSGGTSFLEAVQAVASAMRGKPKQIPAGLQPFVFDVLAANSGKDTPEADDKFANLLQPGGKEAFMASPLFRRSGLNSDQLESLIRAYHREYRLPEQKYFSAVPLSYLQESSVTSPAEAPPAFEYPVAAPPASAPEAADGAFNLGWVQREQGASSFVSFTPLAASLLSSGERRQILQLISREPLISPEESRLPASGTEPHPIAPQLIPDFRLPEGLDLSQLLRSIGGIHFPWEDTPRAAGNPPSHVFSQSAAYQSRRHSAFAPWPTGFMTSGSHRQQSRQPVGTPNRNITGQPPQNQSDEARRFQRIEENYRQDKAMLAKSKSLSSLSGANAPGGGTKEDGFIIQRFAEDVINEIKSEIENEL